MWSSASTRSDPKCRSNLTKLQNKVKKRSIFIGRTSNVAKRDDESSKFFEVNDGMDDMRTIRGDPRIAHEQHRAAGFPQQNGDIARSSYADQDCSEPLVQRLWQQIRELQKSINVLQEAAEFKDRESANSEVSGQTFTSVFNQPRLCSECNQPQCCQFLKLRCF